MRIRFALLIAGAAGLSLPALAADAIDGANSGQRAIGSPQRAITPSGQIRDSAPARLKATPQSGADSRSVSPSVGGTSRAAPRTERFKSDTRTLSDKIEQRRKRFENGSEP